MGIPLIIFGVFGGLLNTIVFLSLRIYRQNSSAFYLTVVSIVDTGQLLTGLLTRVLFNMDTLEWIESSPIFCKLRFSVFELFAIISPTCLCLVAIDQFLSTSTRPQWQQWSNIKIAHRLSAICIIFWLLYGIPYAIYYTPSVSTTTGLTSCVIGNIVYFQYYNIVHIPLFMCGIPLSLTILFGFLASRNIRRHSHQTVPIVRRRHEVQLTMMVLVQVIFNALTTTPSVIVHIISSQSTLTNDPNIAAQLQFAFALTTCLYYVYYAVRINYSKKPNEFRF
jgi:hypothetical protein